MPTMPITNARGFTLMELMLVLLLISVTIGGVAISVSRSSDQDRLYDVGRKLFAQMQFVQDEALIQQRLIGLGVEQQERVTAYHWKQYRDDNWQELEGEPEAVTLPDGITMQVSVDDQLLENLLEKTLNALGEEEVVPPAIIFYPNSDISEFSLTLAYDDNSDQHRYRIYVDERGQLTNSQVDTQSQ